MPDEIRKKWSISAKIILVDLHVLGHSLAKFQPILDFLVSTYSWDPRLLIEVPKVCHKACKGCQKRPKPLFRFFSAVGLGHFEYAGNIYHHESNLFYLPFHMIRLLAFERLFSLSYSKQFLLLSIFSLRPLFQTKPPKNDEDYP